MSGSAVHAEGRGCRVTSRRAHGSRALTAVILCASALLSAGPLSGQEDSTAAPRTYARKGAAIGGIAGGLLGGVGVGILAAAFCEYECGGAFLGGFLYGAAGGGALGGLTGLVVGAAIPRGRPDPPGSRPDSAAARHPTGNAGDGEASPARPWTLRLAGGPRFGGSETLGGTDWWVSLTTLRATTDRVRFGIEAGYLGAHTDVGISTINLRDGGIVTVTNVWERRMFTASMVAARTLGSVERPAGYVVASVGVYPLAETQTSTREGEIPDVVLPSVTSWQETSPFPGIGAGVGGVWRFGGRVGVGLDSRVHLVAGAGDGALLALATLGGTVWIGR